EPRIVQPRPHDPEGGEDESGEALARVAVGDEVRELVGGRADGDDDRQVEEQLQRRGGAVVLVGGAAAEALPLMSDAGDAADVTGSARAAARTRRTCRPPAAARPSAGRSPPSAAGPGRGPPTAPGATCAGSPPRRRRPRSADA